MMCIENAFQINPQGKELNVPPFLHGKYGVDFIYYLEKS